MMASPLSMSRAEAKEKGLTVARKTHVCDLCHQSIEPKEAYFSRKYYPGEFDFDELTTFRACRWCNNAWCKQFEIDGTTWDEDSNATFEYYYVERLRRELGISSHLVRLGNRESFVRLVARCKEEGCAIPPHYVTEANRDIPLLFDDEGGL